MANITLLATGSSGLVASHFKQTAIATKIPFYGLDLSGEERKADITNRENLDNVVSQIVSEIKDSKPVLFHFAALPITGGNITDEQRELMFNVNVVGTKNVLYVCKKYQIPMVHISTDFVFSGGKKHNPYLPTDELCPDDTPYSQTKADAEHAVIDAAGQQHVNIIRIAYPYGNVTHPKMDLMRKMLGWMDTNPEVGLYSDQQTCPAPISYISKACIRTAELIINHDILTGIILHVVGQPTSPYEFGELIKKVFNKKTTLRKTTIAGSGPINLVLDTQDTERYFGFKAPNHEEELKRLKAETTINIQS